MFTVFAELASCPECFSLLTSRTLWTNPHIAEQMLQFHLDPTHPLASRQPDQIESTVAAIDELAGLNGQRVVDLGCGPGLYASRFHARGAHVTGVDWSENSLAYARDQAAAAGHKIDYVLADYTRDPLPGPADLMTLIYCDFCVLSPEQRHELLLSIRGALTPGGLLVMDVFGKPFFESFQEGTTIEHRLMNGFWSADDYIGLKQSIKYDRERVTLDRYLIVEPERHWMVCNWLQVFDPAMLEAELSAAGFQVEQQNGELGSSGSAEDAELIWVVARAA